MASSGSTQALRSVRAATCQQLRGSLVVCSCYYIRLFGCMVALEVRRGSTVNCSQVITVADFHPQHCHTFAFATSKGAIRMADLRTSALVDNTCKIYEEVGASCSPSIPIRICFRSD